MSHNVSMNLPEAVNGFLEYLEVERNSSKLTIRNYRHYLTRFTVFAGELPFPVKTPAQITSEVIREYRLFLSRFIDDHGQPLMRVTQNYHLIAVRAMLRYLIRNDVKTIHPEKIELGKAESKSLK